MSYWYQRARDWTLQLVRLPSVTNTAGERQFAHRLYELLADQPYFQAHPDHLWLERTSDDLHERYNLFALVRGNGPETVVLAGHYDVVSVDNYGHLAPWAFDPEALLPRLIADLAADCRSESDRLALADLKSGNYLPGRGALDMKSGLAAGLAVLLHFAEHAGERQGNLLFITTPDEEESSHGMRSAALLLPAIAQSRQLDFQAAINLDATNDRGDGSEGQAIFLGTVGKLLPAIYVVGRDTHAGVPFDGVNANLLAAEITRRIECNTALSDVIEGAASPPPVSLKQCDLKTQYDVTTPAAAWCYYNVLTHGRSAADVLTIVVELVREALDSALGYLQEQARRYGALTGKQTELPGWQPLVLTFAELQSRVREHNPAAQQIVHDLAQRLSADPTIDLPTLNRRLTEALWSCSGLAGPAAIIGFGSLYYPPAYVKGATELQRRLRRVVEAQASAFANDLDVAIQIRPFFSGISDMSFLGSASTTEDVEAIANNTPAWEAKLRFDYAAVGALDLPTINIGPWGRDYHQRLERVYMPYSFESAPELIWRIVGQLLAESHGRD